MHIYNIYIAFWCFSTFARVCWKGTRLYDSPEFSRWSENLIAPSIKHGKPEGHNSCWCMLEWYRVKSSIRCFVFLFFFSQVDKGISPIIGTPKLLRKSRGEQDWLSLPSRVLPNCCLSSPLGIQMSEPKICRILAKRVGEIAGRVD